MRFRSTRALERDPATYSFRDAVFQGLAPDGGLYRPAEIHELRRPLEALPAAADFQTVAEETAFRLLSPELKRSTVRRIVQRAFPFSPRLRRVDGSRLLLELFHGPSYAFKDFGAGFLACCMEEFLRSDDREAVILVATSGDTGSAVARAFYGKKNIQVVILYPSGRVSRLQEKQLTVLGENITTLEVAGAFDDCQRMAKEAFMDPELRERLTLTSANSINLGRLIPQAFYYLYAWLLLRPIPADRWFFCVPSGNFGNLTAGVYAWRWGLPVGGFVAATNVNDVVPEYLEAGRFTPRPSRKTLSNAMDVGNPSNFERLQAVFEGDWKRMAAAIRGQVVSDQQTLKTMEEVKRKFDLFICPHTAVGWLAAARELQEGHGEQAVILATAHPAKFRETVKDATGCEPQLPEGLREALELPKRSIPMEADPAALKRLLLERFG